MANPVEKELIEEDSFAVTSHVFKDRGGKTWPVFLIKGLDLMSNEICWQVRIGEPSNKGGYLARANTIEEAEEKLLKDNMIIDSAPILKP